MQISDLHHKKIAILGFGKEGQSSLKFLLEQGIEDITILDKNEIDSSSFVKKSIQSITGETYLDTLEDFDIIIKSPGISPFGDKLRAYREKFISGTEIFFSNYKGKVIGITGTKGKSTVSTLLTECLKAGGYTVKLVGNIGSPVLDEVNIAGDESYDYIVYELSSYMLQDFSPKLEIGYVNNIFPCHLDWHYNSYNIYREAKINVLQDAEYKILNGSLAQDREVLDIQGEKIFFDTKGKYQYDEKGFLIDGKYVYKGEVKLEGEHNQKNICGVIVILDTLIQDNLKLQKILLQILPNFGGLPNRIEDIGTYEGIRFINDSYATTPDSTMAAMNTFEASLQTLFVGGQDSGFDFSVLRQAILNSNIQNIIAFPDTSEKIFPEIEMRDYEQAFEIDIEGKILQFFKSRTMKAGVDFAYKTTLPGKVALLSCAAPSFSLWKNREEKASEFINEVQSY